MKKLILGFASLLTIITLASCNGGKSKEFKPSLDINTECSIKVVGDYGNFEALVDEFDKFNVYYPNVELSYKKVDNYKNNLSVVLDGNDKPNIFFSYTWMMASDKYNSVISHMENLSDSKLNINLDCIRESLISRNDNKVLMAPVFSKSYGMLINNDLFKNNDIDIPSNYNELINVCNSFKEKNIKSPIMGYTKKSDSSLMNTIAYPLFVATIANNKEAINLANNLDPQAGEYTRSALTKVDSLVKAGCFDFAECDKIDDNYEKVLLRFLEGDVPMMVCAGDTPSGIKKRIDKSESYTKSPFSYSFSPIPLTDDGGYFIDSPSVEFSVNKDCDNLDMTNEFMRFLISEIELNAMASAKGLISPTKVMSFDSMYSPFANIPADRTISPELIGVKDPLANQIRVASYKVGKGELTVDEAISQYGNF